MAKPLKIFFKSHSFKWQSLKCKPTTLIFSYCLPKQVLYLRRLDQVCHLGERSCGPACLSRGSCIPLKPAICVAEEKLKEIDLIRLPWSTAPTPNHLSFTTHHIFQCLFFRKALLNKLGRSQNISF